MAEPETSTGGAPDGGVPRQAGAKPGRSSRGTDEVYRGDDGIRKAPQSSAGSRETLGSLGGRARGSAAGIVRALPARGEERELSASGPLGPPHSALAGALFRGLLLRRSLLSGYGSGFFFGGAFLAGLAAAFLTGAFWTAFFAAPSWPQPFSGRRPSSAASWAQPLRPRRRRGGGKGMGSNGRMAGKSKFVFLLIVFVVVVVELRIQFRVLVVLVVGEVFHLFFVLGADFRLSSIKQASCAKARSPIEYPVLTVRQCEKARFAKNSMRATWKPCG